MINNIGLGLIVIKWSVRLNVPADVFFSDVSPPEGSPIPKTVPKCSFTGNQLLKAVEQKTSFRIASKKKPSHISYFCCLLFIFLIPKIYFNFPDTLAPSKANIYAKKPDDIWTHCRHNRFCSFKYKMWPVFSENTQPFYLLRQLDLELFVRRHHLVRHFTFRVTRLFQLSKK